MWTWSWYIQTKVLRGELYEALDGLQYVRDNVLFKLLAMHAGNARVWPVAPRPASANGPIGSPTPYPCSVGSR
jgi:hypothetical protein